MSINKIASVFSALFIALTAFAQSGYEFEIRQVFPQNARVVIKAFSFKREMENEISSQSQKLRGNDKNYKILITTPAGKETRYIQNINWIQTVNGVKTYHKAKTTPSTSYPVATVWSGSPCTIDGSPKGTTITHEFTFRVAEGATENYKSEFIEKEPAVAMANALYKEALTEDKLVEYVVYRFEGDRIAAVVDRMSNEKQYNEYLAAKKAEEERLEAERQLAANVDGFRGRMDGLRAAKDSLKLGGIHLCLEALESTASVIPDSIFVLERLDTLYRGTLINGFLPKKGKDYKRIKQHVERLEDESITSRDSLLNYTRNIESILFSPNKK